MDKLPEDATAEQRLERWCQHVMRNPAAGHFDAKRFIADMRARGLLPCFQRLRPRLEAMTAHYCQDSTEGGYRALHDIMVANGAGDYSLAQCQQEVQQAVQRLLSFDWSRMSTWDAAVVNNVYQASDPEAYPIDDTDLQLGYQVVDALRMVLKLASERLNYAFEPFDWQ